MFCLRLHGLPSLIVGVRQLLADRSVYANVANVFFWPVFPFAGLSNEPDF